MTNKEALLSMLPVKVNDDLITKTFNEQDMNEGDTYSPDDEKDLDMVYVELLNFVINKPDISEGGLNVKVNRGLLLREKDRVLKKHGIVGEGNISNGTYKW
ncbi:DUF6706 family protein [Methanohalobium sp.]|uniref:DUF6706 family protein n=1 Tax=Methanohalobium sp. TaxID=2837493 RepID=UPI0025E23C40|nr:DUF6706 family protein [Methanohalobium sp.]